MLSVALSLLMVIFNSALNNVTFTSETGDDWTKRMSGLLAWLTLSVCTVLFRIHAWFFYTHAFTNDLTGQVFP